MDNVSNNTSCLGDRVNRIYFSESNLEKKWSSMKPGILSNFFREVVEPERLEDFMEKRPKTDVEFEIYSNSGDNGIVLVVPTPDSQGKNASTLKDSFQDSTIVFVESSGEFFNYAHSCNAGVKKALELNPRWIIISNDDIKLEKPPNDLFELMAQKNDADFLIPVNAKYTFITKSGFLSILLTSLTALFTGRIYQFKAQMHVALNRKMRPFLINIVVSSSPLQTLVKSFSDKIETEFQMCGFFMIAKADVFKRYKFDETFINDVEDVDLMMRLNKDGTKIDTINFVVDQVGGDSFKRIQTDEMRGIRDIANKIHLGIKLLKRG